MHYLQGQEHEEALQWLQQAATIALQSTCLRAHCGCIIIAQGNIIGEGYNAPPLNKTLNVCFKDSIPKNFKSDRTCCIHAEERAIIQALKHHAQEIIGARLYFIRLDEQGNMARAGKPFCTICSKLALDTGIKEFVLYHDEGICVYETDEYNTLSYQYKT
ncbi:MAG TPA: hypothetical protein VJB87_00145 [Candidatus Nanoarchaeia archaeon]|nr:hypothetical protein [Candidatus Nanoarchaeia archaeon]